MPKTLDIVIFGATGITGQHTIPILAKLCQTKNLTWGVAGRSEKKLKDVLREMEKRAESSFENIPILIADVSDDKSLHEMARQARIIINCCGPFRFYGEQVVKACIDEGTHHVDVTGEVQFMEAMQLKYNKEAEEKGVYIISACAYESTPVDVAITQMQEKFSGTINSVVAYFDVWETGPRLKGSAINYGTWESLVHVLINATEILGIRKKLFPNRLPNFKPKLGMKIIPHKPAVTPGWAVIFPGPDRDVVRRSQRNFYENESKRPVQIETYVGIKKFLHMVAFCFFGVILIALSQFSFGQKLLLKYPHIFSGGWVTRQPPNLKRAENTHYKMTLYAEGWNEKASSPNHEFTARPNKAMLATITGSNPAYGITCVCAALAAVTVVTEAEKMPSKGGVLPPGYAFAKTSLFDGLIQNGMDFQILYEKNL